MTTRKMLTAVLRSNYDGLGHFGLVGWVGAVPARALKGKINCVPDTPATAARAYMRSTYYLTYITNLTYIYIRCWYCSVQRWSGGGQLRAAWGGFTWL